MAILGMLHRTVWRSLPVNGRRALLGHLTRLAAPRASSNARPSAPIIVVGPLSTASGIGQSARLTLRALAASGIPHASIDVSRELMQPVDVPHGASAPSALHGPGILLLTVSANLVPLVLARIDKAVLKDKWIVGYWAWELSMLPRSWREAVPFVNEIWTPSRFVRDAVLPHAGGRPVRVVPHPVAVDTAATTERSRKQQATPFNVLAVMNIASGFTRKNPLGVIAAFRRAFGDDGNAKLVLKVSHVDAYPPARAMIAEATAGAGNIVIEDAVLDEAGLGCLFDAADVVLSLHRSEGFGLVIAEAMLRGIPAIATDWAGSTDLLTNRNGVPVPVSIVPVTDPQQCYDFPGAVWAEPEISQAAAALRLLRDDVRLRDRLGDQARRDAARYLGTAGFSATIEACLTRYPAETGPDAEMLAGAA